MTVPRVISSRVVYENRWLRLREDEIERERGDRGIYSIVEKADCVLIVPLTGSGVVLVEQHRYPVSGRWWEFPQGSWEQLGEPDPETVARAELREETGYQAASWEYLGWLYLAYGYSSQRMHFFAASDLTQVGSMPDPTESDLVALAFSWEQFNRLVEEGRMRDAPSMAALSLLDQHRRRTADVGRL